MAIRAPPVFEPWESQTLSLPSLDQKRRQYMNQFFNLYENKDAEVPIKPIVQQDVKDYVDQRMKHSFKPNEANIINLVSRETGLHRDLLYSLFHGQFIRNFAKETGRVELAKELTAMLKDDPTIAKAWEDSMLPKQMVDLKGDLNLDRPLDRNHIVGLLGAIAIFMHQQGRMFGLKNASVYPEFNKHKVGRYSHWHPDMYRKAIITESARYLNPSSYLKSLANKDDASLKNQGLHGKQVDILRLAQAHENMYLNREANLTTNEDYIKQVEDTWHGLASLMKVETEEKDPEARKKIIENQKTRWIQDLKMKPFQKYQNNVTIRAALSLNRLQETIDRIDRELNEMGNRNIVPHIRNLVDRVMRDLNDGKIDITTAWGKINNLRPVREAILNNPKEELPADTYVLEPAKQNVVYSKKKDKPGITSKEDFEWIRNNSNLFAFPYMSVLSEKETGKKVSKYVYAFNKKYKQRLYKQLDDWYTSAPDMWDKSYVSLPFNEQKNLLKKMLNIFYHDVDAPTAAFTFEKNVGALHDPKYNPDPLDEKNPNHVKFLQDSLRSIDGFLVTLYNWLKVNKDTSLGIKIVDKLSNSKLPKPVTITEARRIITRPAAVVGSMPGVHASSQHKLTGAKKSILAEEKGRTQYIQDKTKQIKAFDQVRYSDKPVKQWPEQLKTQHMDGSIEYNVRSEEELLAMRSELSRKGGYLYIIDLKHGRLYPINLKDAFAGAVYVWKENKNKGGSFATITARNSIRRKAEQDMPHVFMRDGNDKAFQLYHNLAMPRYSPDYRHQIRYEHGAGLWNFIKKGLDEVGKRITNGAVNAGKSIVQGTKSEYKNFIGQEQRNVRNLYQSGSNLIRNPSWKSFTVSAENIGRLGIQPVVSAARETAGISDSLNKIPGLGLVKWGAEWALPPLSLVDDLSHAVKYSGMGSNDPAQYLKTMTSLGSALLMGDVFPHAVSSDAKVLSSVPIVSPPNI